MSTYEQLPEELRLYAQKPLEESHLPKRKYSLRITKQMEHSRGVAWSGKLLSGKQVIAIVENMGEGGCNNYSVKRDDLWQQFVMDAQVAYKDKHEPIEALVQLVDILSSVENP